MYDPLAVHHKIDPNITKKIRYDNVSVTEDVNPTFKDALLNSLRT